MQNPGLQDFQPWLGETCEIAIAGECIPMTLVAASELKDSPREAGGFRLEFLGPSEPVLAQAIMDVTGPTGRYEIFMVPIARDAQGARYEAVFF